MNKRYIKIVLFLLSLFVYVTNKTLASELFPRGFVTHNTYSNAGISINNRLNAAIQSNARPNVAILSNDNSYIAVSNAIRPINKCFIQSWFTNNFSMANDRSYKLYKKYKHLLFIDDDEDIKAEKVMKEAVSLLIQHATSTINYDKPYQSKNDGKLNMAKHEGDAYIGKYNYKYLDPNMYTDIVDMLWDPSCSQKPDQILKNGKIVRVYTRNLIMVQYRYKNYEESFQRYFYVLAAKHQISKNTTVIAMTSGNINDHNYTDTKKYKNPIVKSASLFQTKVNSELDIRKGELKKTFVNLSGYIIKKESDYVDITYVRSINDNSPNGSKFIY
ncbi:fam-a protein [Plasmodium vinckei lentum]|uniref:Fam-a protein n=1 Tax=Plasmodium vinckei lentum TaxID=138297 RepID=A0A6V7S9N0_PLAVN|nr:fam-a protein [Plasmodium vinckei lentum]